MVSVRACGAVPPWDKAECFAAVLLQQGQSTLPAGNGVKVGIEFYLVSLYLGNHLFSEVHLPSAGCPQPAAVEEAEKYCGLLAFHYGDFPFFVLFEQL